MKHKKRIGCIVVLLYCVACCVTMAFSSGGFFSLISAIGTLHGGGHGGPPEWVDKVVDIATAPVQLSIMWPLALLERISSRTGERGRQRKERERRDAQVLRYRAILDEDFENVYAMSDFQCPTNQIAMETLDKWIWCRKGDASWCSNSLPRFAEHVMNHSEMMPQLKSMWRLGKLNPDMQQRGFQKALHLAEESPSEDVRWLLWAILGDGRDDVEGHYLIPDEIINHYTNNPNQIISYSARESLANRKSYRDYLRRHREHLQLMRQNGAK